MNIFIAVLFALLVFEVVKWTAKAIFSFLSLCFYIKSVLEFMKKKGTK